VVILNDEILQVTQEIVRAQVRERVYIALDYFDGSLNRIGAWVTGARSVLKGFLLALLEPTEKLRYFEANNNQFAKMALLEELKHMPFGAIWNYYCLMMDVPLSWQLTDEVMHYENDVLLKRS
jgi:L-rhamnose isomerase